jgi:nucleoside-diphosphate-sugar epimerase
MRILPDRPRLRRLYLRPSLEAAGCRVTVCEQVAAKLSGVTHAVHCRYQELTIGDLAGFDAILWFAGHSSVPMALRDPDGAIANNCLDLLQLAKRKPLGMRLIYASTGSVYSVEDRRRQAAADDGRDRNPAQSGQPLRLLQDFLRFAGQMFRDGGHRPAARDRLRI